MSEAELIAVAKDRIEHFRAGTMALGDDVFRVPASDYFDEGRFRLEVDRIFRRLPLLLAPSAEIPNPGDYKAMTICGTPVLLVRDTGGQMRGYYNSCSHRGTWLAEEGYGQRKAVRLPLPRLDVRPARQPHGHRL